MPDSKNTEKWYQHKVTVFNYDTEMMHIGTFKTQGEAYKFRDTTEGHEKSYSAGMDNWPYGTYSQRFSMDEKRKGWQEFYESHGGDDGKWD